MTSTIPTERPITFYSKGQPALLLEGVIHTLPTVSNAPLVIFCHPQPASSNMHDPLLVTLAGHLAKAGMVVLRFNFRGVGRSQGQQTDGRLEPLDLAGAIDAGLAQTGVNPDKICVVGHAFGAYITLLYAPFDTRIRTLVAISLPLFRAINGFPRQFERPKLFVTGEFDELCPLYKLEPFVESQKGAKGIKVVVGARHLMLGYEEPATTAILKYLNTWAEIPNV
jgi:alpha/beta superfamily hydrolase